MISFPNELAQDDSGGCDRREGIGEPRAVGELMAAVLARYGISVSAEPERPRLPRLEHRSTQLDGLLSVG